MTLQQIMHSLVAVMIHYHDYQKNVPKLIPQSSDVAQDTYNYAVQIFKDKETDFTKKLEELITDVKKSGYSTRVHFLTYLAHEIQYLNWIINRKQQFTPVEFNELVEQISRLFIDFNTLLSKYSTDDYKVLYSGFGDKVATDVSLMGLTNYGSFKCTTCKSGELLSGLVLEKLNITPATKQSEIRAIAIELCTAHQNSLKVEDLSQKLSAAETQLNDKEDEIKLLKAKIKEQEGEVSKLREEISGFRNGITPLVRNTLPPGFALSPQSFLYGFGRYTRQPQGSANPESTIDAFDPPSPLL